MYDVAEVSCKNCGKTRTFKVHRQTDPEKCNMVLSRYCIECRTLQDYALVAQLAEATVSNAV